MGLIAHYRLNSDAKDWFGGRDGQVLGSVSWVDGRLAGAVDLAGGSNWITGDAWPITGDFSYSFWAKQTSVSATSIGGLVGNHWHTSGPTGVNVYFRTSATQITVATADGVSRPSYSVNLVAPNTEWAHYAVTCRGGWVSVYQNGQHLDTRYREIVQHPSRSWAIGRWAASYGSYHFEGLIDDVRIYDHALSPREVRDLSLGLVAHLKFDDEQMIDYSLQGNDADRQGCVVSRDLSAPGGSLCRFNGGRIDVPWGAGRIMGAEDLSLSLWVKADATTGDQMFAAWGVSGSNQRAYFAKRAGKWTMGIAGTVWSGGVVDVTTDWTHIGVVYWGGVVRMYANGTLTRSISFSDYALHGNLHLGQWGDGQYSFAGEMADVRVYAGALTEDQMDEVRLSRASLDSSGNFSPCSIRETGQVKALVDYRSWVAGTVGSATGFSQNGSTSENSRVIDDGPHGTDIVVWQANPDEVSGADGGWNGTNFPIDNTKTYRFSVWIRRKVTGNGTAYLGLNGYGSVNGVFNHGTTTNNTNPYFWTGSMNESQGWVLIVGHVHPVGYSGPMHRDSARYTKDGRLGAITRDFTWRPETTTARHRAYLYYSTNTDTVQQFAYPRVDLCDGTEPSVEDLINGFEETLVDSDLDGKVTFGNVIQMPRFSEVELEEGEASLSSSGKLSVSGYLSELST